MTRRNLILLATLGSAALLGGAFVFQAMGYAPCKMCYWQRWPHGVAIGAGALALLTGWALWIAAGALAALVTGAIGVYHAGVELKFWPGPSSCSGGDTGLAGLSGADLLNTDVNDKVVMCDEVSWAFVGISMAGWNAIFSFGLVVVWLMALRRS
ncbi:MAG: disulfide bond formation protein B [Rhodobacteraceae bacterium]|nr:disulfide bond formation protein B [Paracoccaceae bacterium]